jgi:hypothetical protein
VHWASTSKIKISKGKGNTFNMMLNCRFVLKTLFTLLSKNKQENCTSGIYNM